MRKLQPECDDAFRAALAESARGSDELRFMHRLHVVLLVSLGHSAHEVARWIAEDPRSVERWVHTYRTEGADGLREHHGGGRPARLTPDQLGRLVAELAQPPVLQGYGQTCWSGKLVALHVERRYGAHLSLRHCQRLLVRLGP